MANGDYGYFGKGDTGYAQYMTAFNRNFGGSPALARTVTAMRSFPGTAASMRLNLPGWIPCRLSCGRCRTMLL